MTDFDVLVAGGGPIGLACAIEAATRGHSVAVVDPRTGPIDKACGEGLMPGAVAALLRLGVDPAGSPLRGIAYVDAKHVARHAFRAGPGRGVRRTVLHAALSARAAEVGVVRIDRPAGVVREQGDAVGLGDVSGSWLLACDGLHSPVRRQLALDPTPVSHRRFGLRRHVATAPWSDFVEVHWAMSGEAYVTPVAADLVGVAVLTGRGRSYDDVLDELPGLRDRLAGHSWTTALRGAGPLRQRVRQRVAGRILLVGDAAGYVDALTGEGIRTGLACARAAVGAIEAGDPAAYERDWRRLTRSYRLLTSALLGGTRPAWARSRVVPAARGLPWLYAAAVESLAGGPALTGPGRGA